MDSNNYFFKGTISLWDELIPSVTISRDQIKDLSWEILSNISICFVRILKNYPTIDLSELPINNVKSERRYILTEILEDKLLYNEWLLEPIIPTNFGFMSINEIQNTKEQEVLILKLGNVFRSDAFMYKMISVLIQLHLTIVFRIIKLDRCLIVKPNNESTAKVEQGENLFPPLFFIQYENVRYFKFMDKPLNKLHPFSMWIIQNANLIFEKCPAFLKDLTEIIQGEIDQNKIDKINMILTKVEDLKIGVNDIVQITMKDILSFDPDGNPKW